MKFKVYGRKHQDYTIVVSAPNATEAIKIANNLETHLWTEIENDDVIEAIDVTEYELGNR
ncbi:hypothetical protein EB001_09385 [bacterium]|nr:hypothetical protein [bacterium]